MPHGPHISSLSSKRQIQWLLHWCKQFFPGNLSDQIPKQNHCVTLQGWHITNKKITYYIGEKLREFLRWQILQRMRKYVSVEISHPPTYEIFLIREDVKIWFKTHFLEEQAITNSGIVNHCSLEYYSLEKKIATWTPNSCKRAYSLVGWQSRKHSFNLVYRPRTKNIKIEHHFIRKEKIIEVTYIKTKDQQLNVLTKLFKGQLWRKQKEHGSKQVFGN